MTKPIFQWFPDVESQQECEPTVSVTKFGDGYEARAAASLNSQPQKWTLGFDRDRTTIKEILAFLRARGAVESFTWTTPLEETGTYVCRKWKTTQRRGTIELTCDFEQVFEY